MEDLRSDEHEVDDSAIVEFQEKPFQLFITSREEGGQFKNLYTILVWLSTSNITNKAAQISITGNTPKTTQILDKKTYYIRPDITITDSPGSVVAVAVWPLIFEKHQGNHTLSKNHAISFGYKSVTYKYHYGTSPNHRIYPSNILSDSIEVIQDEVNIASDLLGTQPFEEFTLPKLTENEKSVDDGYLRIAPHRMIMLGAGVTAGLAGLGVGGFYLTEAFIASKTVVAATGGFLATTHFPIFLLVMACVGGAALLTLAGAYAFGVFAKGEQNGASSRTTDNSFWNKVGFN